MLENEGVTYHHSESRGGYMSGLHAQSSCPVTSENKFLKPQKQKNFLKFRKNQLVPVAPVKKFLHFCGDLVGEVAT